MNSVSRTFFELAKEAERIDSECWEEPVEPAFEAVLSHVIAHPEARHEFATAFIQIIFDPTLGPPDLVAYCMHALRWDEVKKELLESLRSQSSERVRYMLRKVLLAFEDDWHEAEFYSRFAR